MSGPKPKSVVIPVSGWVVPPPIDRHQAEAEFGSPIAEATWKAIVVAYRRYGFDRDALAAAPRLNSDRNDPKSYKITRRNAQKKIRDMLEFIREFRENPMSRAICVMAIGRTGAAELPGDLDRHLLDADLKLVSALAVVEAALPDPPYTTWTDADLRKRLARDLVTALKDAGHDVSLSASWDDDTSDAELAPVERLLSALEVPPGDRPSSVARWIREALRE